MSDFMNMPDIIEQDEWPAYREKVQHIIQAYKTVSHKSMDKYSIIIEEEGKQIGRLRSVNKELLACTEKVAMLADWRKNAQNWFFTQFKVTVEGTRQWLENQVLAQKERILFLVEDNKEEYLGHVGLCRFNYQAKCCEIDNILRGNHGKLPGVMAYACSALLGWVFEKLAVNDVYLRVFADNERALNLYRKLGFREIQLIPLRKIVKQQFTRWVTDTKQPFEEVQRYVVIMKLSKSTWQLCK